MKKTLLAVVLAVATIVSVNAAVFNFNDGYDNIITTEDVEMTTYQINEIKNYGVEVKDNEYYVYHKDGNEVYEYTVTLNDNELETIKDE